MDLPLIGGGVFLVFSFDSVIAAVGMVDNLLVIVVAALDHAAVAAATSSGPDAGSGGLTSIPVTGTITTTDRHQEPTGLG